jgi:hypothetical protein
MKKFSVYLIQALYRGHHERQFCRRLRSTRFLGAYLMHRFRWRKRTHASRIIKQAYKRYKLHQRMQQYVLLSRKAIIIQRGYRAHYLFQKAVVCRFAMTMWQHVSLFGVCRATNVICPEAKQKRIIYRCLVNFYSRLRRKRYGLSVYILTFRPALNDLL